MNTAAKQPIYIAAFLAGASKCGTTTLSDLLFQHPQITPLREDPAVRSRLAQSARKSYRRIKGTKEPRIMLSRVKGMQVDWDKGVARRSGSGRWREREFDVELARLLPDTAQRRPDSRQTIAADCSPVYFDCEGSVEAIHDLYPEARIMITLRHPTETVYTRLIFQLRLHRLGEANIDRQLSQWLSRRQTKRRKHYWSGHLRHWLSVFDRQQVKVLILEEWSQQPQQTAQECYRFVGVDDSHKPQAKHLHPVEEAYYPGNRLGERYYKLLRQLGKMKSAHSERYSLYHLAIKAAMVTRLYGPCPHKSAALRQKMDDHFRHDVEAVEHILGRKIPSWHRNG